jgi:prepilin signal peptidase PulO-like enzyme (type II secretory pathway)
MVIVILAVVGLCLGSFVNALVWRVHEQSKQKTAEGRQKLSVLHGRSMCPHCKHGLTPKDLIPVVSWLSIGGKCRYCHKPISRQYPIVEFLTALLFVASYVWWPNPLHGFEIGVFIWWLALLVGLVALTIYDLHWFLLPNRIVYPSAVAAFVMTLIAVVNAGNPLTAALNALLGVAVGGGIFYVLFQVSKGKWIGGGDVKLGWLLGLAVATPARAVLLIFLASVLGSFISVPLLATNRLKRTSTIPFGPFLIIAAVIVQLFGAAILHWYRQTFINA